MGFFTNANERIAVTSLRFGLRELRDRLSGAVQLDSQMPAAINSFIAIACQPLFAAGLAGLG